MQTSTRSMHKSLFFVTAMLGVAVAAPSAWALPRTHDGFYLQMNAGLGYLSSSAEAGGMTVKYSGVTIPTALLLGGTVGPVVIGGGFITDYAPSPSASMDGGQSVKLTDVNMYLYSMGIFADYYLNPSGGLHFQPYFGWGGLQAEYQGRTGSSPTGMVLGMGVGWDTFVADEWSIGVMGRFIYAPLSLNDVSYSTIAPALLATFTYH